MVPREPPSNTTVTGDAGWRMVRDSMRRPPMVSTTGTGAAAQAAARQKMGRSRTRNSVDMGVFMVGLKTPASQRVPPHAAIVRRIDGRADG
jgi:hypothetical protein